MKNTMFHLNNKNNSNNKEKPLRILVWCFWSSFNLLLSHPFAFELVILHCLLGTRRLANGIFPSKKSITSKWSNLYPIFYSLLIMVISFLLLRLALRVSSECFGLFLCFDCLKAREKWNTTETQAPWSLWWPIKFYCDSIYCPFERANQSKIGSNHGPIWTRWIKTIHTLTRFFFYDVLIAPDKHQCKYATFASVFAPLEFPSLIWFGLLWCACLSWSQFDSIFVKRTPNGIFHLFAANRNSVNYVVNMVSQRDIRKRCTCYFEFETWSEEVRHSHLIFDAK